MSLLLVVTSEKTKITTNEDRLRRSPVPLVPLRFELLFGRAVHGPLSLDRVTLNRLPKGERFSRPVLGPNRMAEARLEGVWRAPRPVQLEGAWRPSSRRAIPSLSNSLQIKRRIVLPRLELRIAGSLAQMSAPLIPFMGQHLGGLVLPDKGSLTNMRALPHVPNAYQLSI